MSNPLNVGIESLIKKITNKEELNVVEVQFLEQFLRNKSKYGINWIPVDEFKKINDKEIEINNFLINNKPFLIREEKKTIQGEGNNLLIEGDNYEVLQSLLPLYKEKVDCIYIDPPYNTGKNDFMYNDRFSKKEDSDYHSRWLSFMEKRLKLAHSLLKKDSLIGVSIGKEEFSNLYLLMIQIFGEDNIIHNMVKMTSGGKNDVKYIKDNHEYLLVAKKGNPNFYHNKISTEQNEKDQVLSKWGNTSERLDRPNMAYPIYVNKKTHKILVSDVEHKCSVRGDKLKTIDNLEKMYKKEEKFYNKLGKEDYYQIYPKSSKKGIEDILDGYWRWQKEDLESKVPLLKVKNHKKYGMYIYENVESKDISKDVKRSSVIENYTGGSQELLSLVGKDGMEFPYPKSVEYLKYFINFSGEKNGLFMDFFGGTGTFAQAVLSQNEDDGGKREFILVTNNENNICTKITYPRISNFIKRKNKYSLNVFKLSYFKKERTEYKTKKNLNDVISHCLKIKEGMYEVFESATNFEVFGNNSDKVVFIKDSYEISDTEIDKIVKKYSKNKFYINSYAGESDSFMKKVKGVRYEIVPDEIYNAYKILEENEK